MFKKSKSPQINLFSSSSNLLSGKSQKIYDDSEGWHNKFREVITMRIDESLFKPLFCDNNGTPNASLRVMLAMMILKEAEGLSDRKIFENSRFNMLTRSAIGLLNADDNVPAESTYYDFRKKVLEHAKAGNENLIETCFSQVTKNQSIEFNVSGVSIRMDSKLLGSNIAKLSRYELVHETFRLFFKEVNQSDNLSGETKSELESLLKLEGNKVVYTNSSEEVLTRFSQLGILIHKVLPLFSKLDSVYYQTLKAVFEQQYTVNEQGVVNPREKETISAQSIQSPHDTDCHFRNKDGNKVKGYSMNVTESCDDQGLNLIGAVDVKEASTSDVSFFEEDITRVQEIFTAKTEIVHADGAYHSVDNQIFCKEESIELYLHAIQGAKGRYNLDFIENKLTVFDTKTNQEIDSKEIISKEGVVKWRIDTENGYRYFTQENIDTYLIRKKIQETPIEVFQKRNNVEATIFQLCYHFPNAKSRYRGLIKHQMWANIRCFWVNFVRIINFNKKLMLENSFIIDNSHLLDYKVAVYAFVAFINQIIWNSYFKYENIQYKRV
jgi:Transposase domain (DUF772)